MNIQKEYREIVSEEFMQQLYIELTEEEYRVEQKNCALTPPKSLKKEELYSAAYQES